MDIHLICEKCGKKDTYTQPWKGLHLCFECTLAARSPKSYKICGFVNGAEITTYKEANSETEAMVSFLDDFPNALDIDVRKL